MRTKSISIRASTAIAGGRCSSGRSRRSDHARAPLATATHDRQAAVRGTTRKTRLADGGRVTRPATCRAGQPPFSHTLRRTGRPEPPRSSGLRPARRRGSARRVMAAGRTGRRAEAPRALRRWPAPADGCCRAAAERAAARIRRGPRTRRDAMLPSAAGQRDRRSVRAGRWRPQGRRPPPPGEGALRRGVAASRRQCGAADTSPTEP